MKKEAKGRKALCLILMVVSFLPLVCIVGCAGSPIHLSTASPKELREYNNVRALCNAYHFTKDKEILVELKRRNLFTDEEWKRINSGNIKMGDSHLLLMASWGDPVKINRTVILGGAHEQWVYSSSYVYLDNGVITGWQD